MALHRWFLKGYKKNHNLLCIHYKHWKNTTYIITWIVSQSVVESAEDNTKAGGHIWQHIRGVKARPKGAEKAETQDDKILFASERDYQRAWQAFKTGAFGYLTPYQCKGKPKGRAECRLCSCCRNWSEHSVRVYSCWQE